MELWNKRKPRAAAALAEKTLAEEPTESRMVAPASVGQMDIVSLGTTQTTKEKADAVALLKAPSSGRVKERSFQAKLEWRLDDDHPEPGHEDNDTRDIVAGEEVPQGPAGVLKCRCDQRMRLGLLYEGRYKSLLFSLGTDINLRKLDAPFRTVGLAVQFSS